MNFVWGGACKVGHFTSCDKCRFYSPSRGIWKRGVVERVRSLNRLLESKETKIKELRSEILELKDEGEETKEEIKELLHILEDHMKSEWFVQSNPIGGEYHYIASRIRNKGKVVHSGNIEHYGEYQTDREPVQELVNKLNAGEIEA